MIVRRDEMTTIVRRRKLGMSSVKGIANASKTGIKWKRSDKFLPPDDLYIRWGCTVNVPSKNVLNTAKAIHEVNDKAGFRIKLSDAGLAVRSTLDIESISDDDYADGWVFRPAKHAQGRHTYKLYSYNYAARLAIEHPNYYLSEFFDKTKEYRIAIVQGRAVWVVEKTPSNVKDLAWNVAKGGRFDNVRWDNWPLKAVKYAIEAFNLSSLDFGGVDVMVDVDGEVSVLEINSAPSLTSPYRQESMAKAFDWIVNEGKERIPLIEQRGGYSKFIHPCMTNKAKLIGEV